MGLFTAPTRTALSWSHDLVLGVVALELDGRYPFLELADHQLERCFAGEFAGGLLPGEEGLGQLLGDGAAASAGAGIAQEDGLDPDPGQAAEVDAAVIVEADVLGGYGGGYDIGGQLVVSYVRAVLDMVGSYQFPVF